MSEILNAITATLGSMGGEARLVDLSRELERRYPKLVKGWDRKRNTMSGYIYANSSDAAPKVFKGTDIFYRARDKGVGV